MLIPTYLVHTKIWQVALILLKEVKVIWFAANQATHYDISINEVFFQGKISFKCFCL